jgi:2-oxoglutarate dehydrogenase E2 component (dihydrolipoamide succinyltransferase)
MTTEIRVPTLGESVTEATVAQWFKQKGEAVSVDEPLVELETDKVTVEVPAPASGVIESIDVADGDTVEVGALLGAIAEGAVAKAKPAAKAEVKAAPAAVAAPPPAGDMPPAPSAAKMMAETGTSAGDVAGSGKRGQILKGDVIAALENPTAAKQAPVSEPRGPASQEDGAREERVKMTRLRQTIARRLKDAQDTAAMLTTFNEVDMTNVMALRSDYKELFEKKHGVKLGFMGFFAKTVIAALEDVPAVNAEIDGTDLVYKNYCHIGVAVGTEKGLVVPVVRNAQDLSLAGIEKEIGNLGRKARDGKLTINDMMGGTFTISNGGVYGSLMSTPILNAPQSGILGMHKIQQRPMVVNGEIVARPMMYLALSYDHRVVDGKEAVTFLVRVKEAIEDPQRLILDL